MRAFAIGRLLVCVSIGAGLALSSAIPIGLKKERSVALTDSTDAAETAINWKVVRGGLKVTRDVIVVAAGATSAIAAVVVWIQSDSSKNTCSPISGSGQSDNGQQKYNFKYWVTTTGKNCDTTAQTKTVSAALDDAWDDVHKRNYDYACLDFSHGGTWHGHLAMATVDSGVDVNTMCN
ncbi:uncharacterized protein N7503_000342 [Penicillium pulvis]|uniref:uncharacterized protein n=1 Tax=Penicillium pulvis TaxID=1562058 RepID=UPI002548D9F7|nr:uncharacterized protein N7503_000342 [Penicillium pulvis]KAJ5813592.1 hypothetical protein N7503_000342 [Penicillium pulvis]